FKKVCEKLNAKSIISDLDDDSDEPLSISGISEMIKQNLTEKEYDYIFTHGENGEYGHIRHVGVHEAMKSLVKTRDLTCEYLWFFSYIPGTEKSFHDQETIIPVPNEKSDWVVSLTEEEHKQKISLVVDVYGFQNPTFESQACAKKEAFSK
ncbi:MAG: hypothetical protein KC506_03925, partial [Nanoarchaeota archaeon]|nr:hypothetical protein [Nanoarchaeota archaeon]